MALRLHGIDEANTTETDVVQFRIYVGGDAPNSLLAVRNLRAFCASHFDDKVNIDIVDVLLSPERAWEDGVMVTPTSMRISPSSSPPIVGNLSDLQVMLQVFGLPNG
jgi:circadian clock protein KaiB